MKFYFVLFMLSLILIAGCSKQVAKETAQETAKDVVQKVDEGIKDASQTVVDAAPYIEEDFKNGFWNTLDAIDVLVTGDSPEKIPTPEEIRAMQLQKELKDSMDRGVVVAAKQISKEKINEPAKGLATLAGVIEKEIAASKESAATNADGTVTPSAQPDKGQPPVAKPKPTPEEIKEAWVTLSKLADKPETARALFQKVQQYVDAHPELNAKAGIAGPVEKAKVGNKANEFLSKLEPGQVSDTVKFMNGYLIVQLIDNTNDKYEVGYIYIPGKPAETPVPQSTP